MDSRETGDIKLILVELVKINQKLRNIRYDIETLKKKSFTVIQPVDSGYL